jgi:PKHD-type hydroxylase
MLIQIADVLTGDEVREARKHLAEAEWVDGRATSGYMASEVKRNAQVKEGTAAAQAVGDIVLRGLARSKQFMSFALPLRVFPPMFNSYAGGQTFGNHIDTAVRQVSTTGQRIRADVSCTLFLTPPEEYEGGELVVEDSYGEHRVKLPMGHMVVYPSTSLHRVEPVLSGNRVSSFFWVQSMVRTDARRTLLYELDSAIQRVAGADVEGKGQDAIRKGGVELTGVYHNLLREWAEM